VIDTVFDEQDYGESVTIIETFAHICRTLFNESPSLVEFDTFIRDKGPVTWQGIEAVRFLDVPAPKKERNYLKVSGFRHSPSFEGLTTGSRPPI